MSRRESLWRFPLHSGQGTINVNSWSPVRFRGVSDAAVVITMIKHGVIAISMQGAKQWKDSGA